MDFDIEIGGRVRRVRVTPHGSGLSVAVDGHAYAVDARAIGDRSLSLLIRNSTGATARSVDASVTPNHTRGVFDVQVAGRMVSAQVRRNGLGANPAGTEDRPGSARAAGGHGAGPERVTSPMPGRIVRVLVGPGDRVAARQGLVVVEAMKMENELRAARAGRVRDVVVAEGQLVEAGALLVIVAADDAD